MEGLEFASLPCCGVTCSIVAPASRTPPDLKRKHDMADFCTDCSIKTFGEDSGDLAGISTPEDTAKQLFGVGICEGCGATLFDHTGACADIWCEIHGIATREHLNIHPKQASDDV